VSSRDMQLRDKSSSRPAVAESLLWHRPTIGVVVCAWPTLRAASSVVGDPGKN